MRISVFLASRTGNDPSLKEIMESFGRWMAEHGHTLVYGGANDGLMTVLADSVLDHGGKVIGVMPSFMAAMGRRHENLSEAYLTESMDERKKMLIEMGDAWIAMPGGQGTLEEISQAMSSVRLGLTSGKCVFLNYRGFYEPMKALLANMQNSGFIREEELSSVYFADTLEDLERILQ